MTDAPETPVAVLFARSDSVYKTIPGCDVYDEARDARTYADRLPVVAHPPCARWSKINGVVLSRYPHKADAFAWGNDGGLFAFALAAVRANGGILEHPADSLAFFRHEMPRVGRGPDRFGGWAFQVRQVDFGHRAEKRTWLYVVGVQPDDLPELPPPAEPSGMCMRVKQSRDLQLLGKADREHTPPAFAAWLVEVARRSRAGL